MNGKLIIARHHESEWNKLGKWTGSRDVHLTEYGFRMSEKMGETLRGLHIDHSFVSGQIRTYETLLGIEAALHSMDIPTEFSNALNERDYGDYTGKNKWEMERILGEDEFNKLRREWDYPVPNGETLKMVYGRAIPFYISHILPLLKEGKNILIVSHGNAIRALMKYIESIPDEAISSLEMIFGSILIYDVDDEGKKTSQGCEACGIKGECVTYHIFTPHRLTLQ